MAKEWSIPPWEVEKNLTAKWFVAWMEYKEAEDLENKRLSRKQEKKYGSK